VAAIFSGAALRKQFRSQAGTTSSDPRVPYISHEESPLYTEVHAILTTAEVDITDLI
jgi:hypothetical protein